MNRRVIVTGATGLIGRESLAPLIHAGFDVFSITVGNSKVDSDVKSILCDIHDERAIKAAFEAVKPAYLLHFAWIATGDYLTNSINFEFVKSGLNLLKYFHVNGGKRIVCAGTCFEYAHIDRPLKESDSTHPQSVYAVCKDSFRRLAEEYCRYHNIDFGWGRIFYVYGYNESKNRLTSHLIHSLIRNKPVTIHSGNLVRDYIFTKDIAGAFVKFLDSNVTGIVNISTGQGISIHDFSEMIARKLNKLDYLVVHHDEFNQPPVIVGDNTRLTHEVGYQIQHQTDTAIQTIIEHSLANAGV